MKYRLSGKGFTLLEMMLVLVIAASLLAMFINFSTQQYHQQQRDKVVMQMQQILNSALSFYNQKGRWPVTTGNVWVALNSTNELISGGYLAAGTGPSSAWISPFNNGVYKIGFNAITNIFFVEATLVAGESENLTATAQVIAAQLPSGTVLPQSSNSIPPISGACVSGAICLAAASVPPPGQNLNNARAINFGSVYSSGQCVPTPTCPVGMTPQIFVVPVSLSGLADMTNQAAPNVYPISSYIAYAVGPFLSSNSSSNVCDNTTGSGGTSDDCSTTNIQGGANNKYWRVCLSVTTEKGVAHIPQANQTDTKNLGSVIAVTRCVPGSPTPTEKTGSTFQIYQ